MKMIVLVTALLFAPWPFANDHFVAVLGPLRTWLSGPFALRVPAPNRNRMLVRFRFTSSTSVRVVVTNPTVRIQSAFRPK
jgi:hypothetical protein